MHARHSQRGRERPVTSLIFPTYNPGAFLEQTWQAVERFLRHGHDTWEALFVCDGCSDGAPDRLLDWSRALGDRVRVLSYAPNRGKGYAVRHGLAEARGRWRIFTDVDLAYSFDDVERVAAALAAGADVAIASRLHPDSRLLLPPGLEGYAYRRHLQSLVFSRLVRSLLPVPHRDTQAGLKGLSAAAARRLLPVLRCDGFGFDCELLTAGILARAKIVEVPVFVRYDDTTSTTSLRSVAGMVQELWRIRRRLRDWPKVGVSGCAGPWVDELVDDDWPTRDAG